MFGGSVKAMQDFLSQGVRIAYIDAAAKEGDRDEPILLIHGFASNHAVNWVFPHWVQTLTAAGRRVIAFDNRGHGQSEKLYRPEDYAIAHMADDALNLLDHLGIARADVMGYSLGARIATMLTLSSPQRVRSLILGGVGGNLVDSPGLGSKIAEALEAPSAAAVSEQSVLMFRTFAEATKSDLKALAACSCGARRQFDAAELGEINRPVLVAAGTKDEIARDAHRLASLFARGQVLDIPGRDHNRSVGDAVFKKTVLEFLAAQS